MGVTTSSTLIRPLMVCATRNFSIQFFINANVSAPYVNTGNRLNTFFALDKRDSFQTYSFINLFSNLAQFLFCGL